MNNLSSAIAVSGYISESSTENDKTLLHIPQMTFKGAIVHKVICDNIMLSSVGVSEQTKILVEGQMISGIIYAEHILILN